MNPEIRELLNSINTKKEEAKALLNDKKMDEAKAARDELKELQAQLEIAQDLYDEEKSVVVAKSKQKGSNTNNDTTAAQAFYKYLAGKPLTEAENALITGGENGEDVIIPVDVNTTINEYRQEFKSARHLAGYYATGVLAGSFVYEESKTMVGLDTFDDGDDIPEMDKPKFVTKQYKVSDRGATLQVSKRLMEVEAGQLMQYLGKQFTRKAIISENQDIFASLAAGRTAKELTGWETLAKSLNVDLDPVFSSQVVVVTNQDGFNALDEAKDENGRPVLQPMPTDATKRTFKGYPVEVFSNTQLKNVDGKAPVFYGATTEAVEFIERKGLTVDTSEHFNFNKNQLSIRIIESYDVMQKDKDASLYGLLALTAPTTP